MAAISDAFLHKIVDLDVLAKYTMSLLIADVFLPMTDPTYNDALAVLNHDLPDDLHRSLWEDTHFQLAHGRVVSSLAAFHHQVREHHPLRLQELTQFGPKAFSAGINLDLHRVATLASVTHLWFGVCTSQLVGVRFLAIHRLLELSTLWNIPASVRSSAEPDNHWIDSLP